MKGGMKEGRGSRNLVKVGVEPWAGRDLWCGGGGREGEIGCAEGLWPAEPLGAARHCVFSEGEVYLRVWYRAGYWRGEEVHPAPGGRGQQAKTDVSGRSGPLGVAAGPKRCAGGGRAAGGRVGCRGGRAGRGGTEEIPEGPVHRRRAAAQALAPGPCKSSTGHRASADRPGVRAGLAVRAGQLTGRARPLPGTARRASRCASVLGGWRRPAGMLAD